MRGHLLCDLQPAAVREVGRVAVSQKVRQPISVSIPAGSARRRIIQRIRSWRAGCRTAVVRRRKLEAPLHLSLDGFIGSFSRSRFNITTGSDRNGDTQYNEQPAFATNPGATSIIYKTAYGPSNVVPQPGEAIIPYNYALAPRTVFTAFEVNREIKFGPRPDAPTPATTAKPG